MDLGKVLEQLRAELAHLDAAIVSLERLQVRETRRGRPPKALAELRRTDAMPADQVRQARRAPTE